MKEPTHQGFLLWNVAGNPSLFSVCSPTLLLGYDAPGDSLPSQFLPMLNVLSVDPVDNANDGDYAIRIVEQTGSKPRELVLFAPSAADRTTWVRHLRSAVQTSKAHAASTGGGVKRKDSRASSGRSRGTGDLGSELAPFATSALRSHRSQLVMDRGNLTDRGAPQEEVDELTDHISLLDEVIAARAAGSSASAGRSTDAKALAAALHRLARAHRNRDDALFGALSAMRSSVIAAGSRSSRRRSPRREPFKERDDRDADSRVEQLEAAIRAQQRQIASLSARHRDDTAHLVEHVRAMSEERGGRSPSRQHHRDIRGAAPGALSGSTTCSTCSTCSCGGDPAYGHDHHGGRTVARGRDGRGLAPKPPAFIGSTAPADAYPSAHAVLDTPANRGTAPTLRQAYTGPFGTTPSTAAGGSYLPTPAVNGSAPPQLRPSVQQPSRSALPSGWRCVVNADGTSTYVQDPPVQQPSAPAAVRAERSPISHLSVGASPTRSLMPPPPHRRSRSHSSSSSSSYCSSSTCSREHYRRHPSPRALAAKKAASSKWEMLRQLLTSGRSFIKHSSNGKRHLRFIYLTPDLRRLCWTSTRHLAEQRGVRPWSNVRKPPTAASFVNVGDIHSVSVGPPEKKGAISRYTKPLLNVIASSVFGGLTPGFAAEPGALLTFYTRERYLTLEANTPEEAQWWATAWNLFLNNYRTRRAITMHNVAD